MTGFTEADFIRLVVPFLAGMTIGAWLKKPVEAVLTLVAIVALARVWDQRGHGLGRRGAERKGGPLRGPGLCEGD